MTRLVAGFDSENALRSARRRFPRKRWAGVEIYSPMPVAARTRSAIPAWMCAAGLAGFVAFFVLMTHASVHAYPVDIGGRPRFAWPAFIPIAFELAALCAMAAGFAGFFIACRLPRLYRPIDESRIARRALRDLWILEVCVADANGLEEARTRLRELGPVALEELP